MTYTGALAAVLDRVRPCPAETLSLARCLGRVLASEVRSPIDLPGLDLSARDGYALNSGAIESQVPPVRLAIVGQVFAGEEVPHPLEGPVVVRIATGAPLPRGSDTVIPFEEVREDPDYVEVLVRPSPGQHVRKRSEEVRKGELLVETGFPLGPYELEVIASVGIDRLSLFKAPRVAIFCTGSELKELPGPPTPPGIVASNLYFLSALVEEAGCVPVPMGTVPDDEEEIASRYLGAVEQDAVVSSGGASQGARDLSARALAKAGGQLLYRSVAMTPGGRHCFATLKDKPVFLLPGTPGAALCVFEAVVRPALLKMAGRSRLTRLGITADCSAHVSVPHGVRGFIHCRLLSEPGKVVARPVRGHQPPAVPRRGEAWGLIIVEEDRTTISPGEQVLVRLCSELSLNLEDV